MGLLPCGQLAVWQLTESHGLIDTISQHRYMMNEGLSNYTVNKVKVKNMFYNSYKWTMCFSSGQMHLINLCHMDNLP